MTASGQAGQSPALSDPVTCGEDLPHNLRRMAELAAIHCRGCADYHISTAAARMTGHVRSTTSDRPRLASLIGRLARDVAGSGPIDVVIAGAGDTGIFATAAHAASVAGDDIIARCRFTVLDLCPTPVLLCQEFGRVHRLDIRGETVDITQSGGSTPADFIIMHGLLRLIVRERHGDALRHLAAQLKPDGRIVVSNRIRPPSNTDAYGIGSGSAVLRMVAEGLIESPEPVERFMARIKRHASNSPFRPQNEIESAEAARRLFEEVGLPILLFEVFEDAAHASGPTVRPRPRLHAVLGAPRDT